MNLETYYWLDLAATAVFAITGALVAKDRDIDLYGVIVFGCCTAVGGGTVRDILIGRTPVFWVADHTYLIVAIVAAIATFIVARMMVLPQNLLIILDALGLGLFTIIGAEIALRQDTSALIAVVMGILTGTGGGMIRDLLAGKIPLVLQKEIYATAALAGAICFVAWPLPISALRDVVCMFIVVAIRLWSIYVGGALPLFLQHQPAES